MANEYFKYAKTACEYFHMDMPPYEEYKGNDIFGMVMCARVDVIYLCLRI